MSHQISCPSCGYTLNAQAPVCGNCGHDLRGYQVGPFDLPGTNSGPPKGLVALVAAIAILGGAFALYGDEIRELVDDIETAFEETDGSDGPAPPIPGQVTAPTYRFRRVSQIVNVLNAGGLRCRNVVIDVENEVASTGSCRAGPVHVQINLYFFEPALRGAGDILRDSPVATVHDENWWIITQDQVARRIHKILGGRLRTPRGLDL